MAEHHKDENERGVDRGADSDLGGRTGKEEKNPDPPRTTTGPLTAPKFGSAGSGGAELEPGPERD